MLTSDKRANQILTKTPLPPFELFMRLRELITQVQDK